MSASQRPAVLTSNGLIAGSHRASCGRCRVLRPSPIADLYRGGPTQHRYNYHDSRKVQLQQYLDQARISIQGAIRALQLHRARLSGVVATRAGEFGTHLNQVSGYEDIDRLKAAVVNNETQLRHAREVARSLKIAYDQAVATRATAQKSVNSLLERKDRWSDSDVADFTSLIRSDHASNSAVTQTSAQLDAAEGDVDRLFSELTQSILTRYHEEQVWSDKIRSFSTYANLIGLAINLIVFVGAIAFVEPWKRRKLAEGLESRMSDMMQKVQHQISALTDEMSRSNEAFRQQSDTPMLTSGREGRGDSFAGGAALVEEPHFDIPTNDDSLALARPPLQSPDMPDRSVGSRLEQYQHQLATLAVGVRDSAQSQPAYLAGVAGLLAGAALSLCFR